MIAAINMNASVDKLYLVENWEAGAVNRVKECRSCAGGKGMNVARVARRCGRDVTAGGLAGGETGRFLRAELRRLGVQDNFTDTGLECRSCINIREQATGVHTEFLEPGPQIPAGVMEQFWKDYEVIQQESGILILSGSVPCGVPADCYKKMIQRAHKANKPVLLDTSGKLLEEGLSASPYLVKPNRDELSDLLGHPVDPSAVPQAAEMLCSRYGVKIAAVSLGEDGVVVAMDKKMLWARPPRGLKIQNTVGCGDSMMAAFAVMLEQNAPLDKLVQYSVAVSAANALTWETGDCRPEDIARLLPMVQVEQIRA